MLYRYDYITIEGKKRHASLEAGSLREAKERLRHQKIWVTALREMKQSKSKRPSARLKKQALFTFTTQLASLLQAGMPLYEGLLCLEDQYRQEPFHPLLLSLGDQIKSGASLSSAMKLFPTSFNKLYCALIAAGEAAGTLGSTLESLASLLQKQLKLEKQVLTALLYPALLLSFSLIVIGIMLTCVIPSLESLFEGRDVASFTRVVIGCSHFFTRGWPIYLPLIGGITLLSLSVCRSHRFKRLLQKLWLKIPVIKTVVTQSAVARFSRTMSTLLKEGVPLVEALQIARKTMRNPHLEEVIEQSEKQVVEGSMLSQELKKSSLIPPLVPRMLAIAEEGGDSAKMLGKIADLYEEEVERSLTRAVSLVQPLILLLMGTVVGLIMFAVLLPLSDVSSFI